MSTASLGRQDDALRLSGRLDGRGAAAIWAEAVAQARGTRTLDLSGVEAADMSGIALIQALREAAPDAELRGTPEPVARLLARAEAIPQPEKPAPAKSDPLAPFRNAARAGGDSLAFVGEVTVAAAAAPIRRRQWRWSEFWRAADEAGVRALPLTLLLGFLIGLILAFQSAIPMRRFGADIFVANLVTISLVRELGPLLAAVILSGRTGSAFAAELGTMRVNEEIDALNTMGLDPVTLLVLPRMLAATLVMPALALALSAAGMAGMASVLVALGYPLELVRVQASSTATMTDLAGGLFKAAVFGLAIAAIACRAGLAASRGPQAVGQAATAAVVGGIVVTILLDGVFAVLFFRLGL
jgi:phospholipid/cholesterol/gamma-HCH transport system permease protein